MSVFFNHVLQDKKYILIMIFVVFVCGFFFGFYQYDNCQNTVLNYMQNLFYLNSDEHTNQYTLYLTESILMIIICTYLSSSYIGFLGILLLTFLKGMQIVFSFLYVFTTISIDVFAIVVLIVEVLIEIVFIFLLSLNCFYLSLYVSYVTFFSNQQLNIKEIINYLLNIMIISLIFLTISLCFRLYIIPLF